MSVELSKDELILLAKAKGHMRAAANMMARKIGDASTDVLIMRAAASSVDDLYDNESTYEEKVEISHLSRTEKWFG